MISSEEFASRLVRWQQQHGRHDLPWQQGLNDLELGPYRVWVSEIMLQQTQVATAIPYYQRFMSSFPSVAVLAAADIDEVLAHWAGLGYYARARNLHKAAQQVVAEHGALPLEMTLLEQLPGIGRSTAAAICSLAGSQATPILDGNVKRVLARWAAIPGWPGQSKVLKALWTKAEQLMPQHSAKEYNQGLMDLGAMICRRSQPDCSACPVAEDCQARLAGNPEDYPGRKPQKSIPKRQTRLLLLCDDNQILLEKRPPSGIWGGLWSLPESALERDSRAEIQERWGLAVTQAEALTAVLHRFSHFELEMRPELCRVQAEKFSIADHAELKWLSLNSDSLAKIGTPKPVHDIIRSLIDQQSPSATTE